MSLQAFNSSWIFLWGEYSWCSLFSFRLIRSIAATSGMEVQIPNAVVVLARTTAWGSRAQGQTEGQVAGDFSVHILCAGSVGV